MKRVKKRKGIGKISIFCIYNTNITTNKYKTAFRKRVLRDGKGSNFLFMKSYKVTYNDRNASRRKNNLAAAMRKSKRHYGTKDLWKAFYQPYQRVNPTN